MTSDAITQADRLAAADLIEAYWSGADESMMKLAKSYRAGHSHGAFVRAFAKHRTTSLAAQDGLVEALGDALFNLSAKLNESGFLKDDANHAAYEKVVAAFTGVSAIKGDKS